MNNFYVYEHWRPDKDLCFYVGKGKGGRAYNLNRKDNNYHTNIIKKLARLGLCAEIRIVQGGLVEAEAFLLEIERISFWKSVGVQLANKTVGGEGPTWLEESREKLRKTHAIPEVKKRLRASVTAAHARPETKAKHRAATKAAHILPTYKEKQRIATNLAWKRPGTKENHSAAMASPKVKENIGTAAKNAWALPGVKEKHSSALKSFYARPGNKEALVIARGQPKAKSKQRAATKAAMARPEIKEKLRLAWVRRKALRVIS